MLTRLARKALRPLGVELVSREEINFYRGLPPAALLYSQLQEGQRNLIAAFHSASKSQLGQDLFALAVAGSREPHYFVEFGATDGLSLSNTYLLEKELHWQGLIAEPAKFWHERLRANRSCNIDTRCVWTSSGKSIKFLEAQPGKIVRAHV